MRLFKIVLTMWILLLCKDMNKVFSVPVDYSIGVIFSVPTKFSVLFDLNQAGLYPNTVYLEKTEPLTPKFFLTNLTATEATVRKRLQGLLASPGVSNVNAGGLNLTVIGTIEFRYLKVTNMVVYDAVIATINKVIEGFQVFNNQMAMLIITDNDEAWSYYAMGKTQQLIRPENGLLLIDHYKIVLVFKLSYELTIEKNYTSQNANKDGFYNYFSVQINCAGPEVMEIKSNNYVARKAKENNVAADSEIKFPCYSVGMRIEYDIRITHTDFEYCDHETYVSYTPPRYIIIGAYNKEECFNLIDTIITTKYGCKNIQWCSLKDIPSNILSYTLKQIILNLQIELPRLAKISQITQAWLDAEIADACSAKKNKLTMQKYDKCFYMNYLNYIYHYLQLKKHNYTTIYKSMSWFDYFIFGPKHFGAGPTGEILPPLINSSSGGDVSYEEESNFGMIMGIFFGIIGVILLVSLVICVVKIKRNRKTYTIIHT